MQKSIIRIIKGYDFNNLVFCDVLCGSFSLGGTSFIPHVE